jgi:hypothetical protein
MANFSAFTLKVVEVIKSHKPIVYSVLWVLFFSLLTTGVYFLNKVYMGFKNIAFIFFSDGAFYFTYNLS